MTHPNAALTPRHRLKVAQLVVEEGWPISEVAARFQVSWPTAKRWADRYRAGESMHDRSSRPHHSPNKTHPKAVKRCISLRMRLREGPVQLAPRLGIAPSTVHRILSSCHLNRLTHVDRATGEPIRRYEHDYPGAMLHVDVKKLGNIPDGGGWRYVGRRQGEKNRAATPNKPRNKYSDPLMGKAYVHTVIDDWNGVTWIAPNPFGEPTAYLLLHPAHGSDEAGASSIAEGFGLRRLDLEAEMMWVGTDDLVASLRGDRVTLWRGAEPWWAHQMSDEWTGAAIGRRYVVLVVGSDAITRTDPVELSAYLTRRERVHAGLVKIRLRVTDQ